MDVKYGSKLASLLMVLVVVLNFNNVFLPLKIMYYLRSTNAFAWLLVVMGLLFLVINLIAAVGLYRQQWWGFVSAYVAILFSTIIFSASYIPFFTRIFPASYYYIALIAANLAVISLVIYLQMLSRRVASGASKSKAQKRVSKRKK